MLTYPLIDGTSLHMLGQQALQPLCIPKSVSRQARRVILLTIRAATVPGSPKVAKATQCQHVDASHCVRTPRFTPLYAPKSNTAAWLDGVMHTVRPSNRFANVQADRDISRMLKMVEKVLRSAGQQLPRNGTSAIVLTVKVPLLIKNHQRDKNRNSMCPLSLTPQLQRSADKVA